MRKPADGGSGGHALLVAAGIFISRIFGLVRTKVLAYYFGLGDEKDAYAAALRIPNVLQNLFGEGALSASFIPVYARLLAEGDEREARRVAGAVFSLLALLTAVLVLLGVTFAEPIVGLLARGFEGEKRLLTIQLVRIFFPGVGLLVLAAWCLGVLNSHRRFLLSYASPVLWNLAIIAALVAGGGRTTLPELARWAAWGAVVGSALQFGVQFPVALRLARGLRPSLGRGSPNVRTVLRNFGPALVGRGAAQIGGTVDLMIASELPARAVGAIADAQMIYTLPVSLFGMSISAAELPAMSSVTGSAEEIATALRSRIATAARRVSFFVVPSAAAFLTLGDQIAAVILQGGEFGAADSRYVWAVLAGSAVGLLAATLARLLSSSFYALRDTRTPLRFALARIALGIALGIPAALLLPGVLGIDRQWGAALLTLASGIAGWVEFALLRRAIGRRIGGTDVGAGRLAQLWGAALVAAAVAWGAKLLVATPWPQLTALVVLGVFGVTYLALTAALGIGETAALTSRLRRRSGR